MKVNEYLDSMTARATQQITTGEAEVQDVVQQLASAIWEKAVQASATSCRYFRNAGDLTHDKQAVVKQCEALILELVGEQRPRYDEKA